MGVGRVVIQTARQTFDTQRQNVGLVGMARASGRRGLENQLASIVTLTRHVHAEGQAEKRGQILEGHSPRIEPAPVRRAMSTDTNSPSVRGCGNATCATPRYCFVGEGTEAVLGLRRGGRPDPAGAVG